jgi:hypothetical protein
MLSLSLVAIISFRVEKGFEITKDAFSFALAVWSSGIVSACHRGD